MACSRLEKLFALWKNRDRLALASRPLRPRGEHDKEHLVNCVGSSAADDSKLLESIPPELIDGKSKSSLEMLLVCRFSEKRTA
mmetsp:Transcript_9531/g.17866  ORF Transcript_9531/g.17866 Transcript_9531/m.17866 type:complete len:83 (+) Transcript_9531:582-830(+)